MDARQVSSTAHPLLALGMVPKRAHHLPAVAAILRAKQPAGQCSTPDDARLVGAAGRERPDASSGPVYRPPPHVLFLVAFRFRGISWGCDFLPAITFRAVKLHPEMSVVESCIGSAVAPITQRESDVVAEEVDGRDSPLSRLARDCEQAFARRYV